MANIDLNVSPYFDDFDPNKDFLRVLFRPGFPVQARELTTLQSILQEQIKRFGDHVFKQGSRVTGARINFDKSANRMLLSGSNNSNFPTSGARSTATLSNIEDFIGKTISNADGSVKAKVLVSPQGIDGTVNSGQIFIKYITAKKFDVTGDYNNTTLNQGGASGADDNRILMDIDGDYNTVSSTQTHNGGIGTNGHYLSIDIDGDSNNLLTSQTNDGDKKAFISLQGDDNDIDLYQQGTGTHYVEIATDSDQTVDVTQDGSGNHNASISMTGYSATLDLTQDSSTGQVYSINQNCLTVTGCGTTTVTQQ